VMSDAVMRLNGRRHCDRVDDCLLFDLSAAEIQPGEAVPLLKYSSNKNFEMAPVHTTKHNVSGLDTLRVNSAVNPSVEMNSKLSYFQISNRGISFIVIVLTCYSNATYTY